MGSSDYSNGKESQKAYIKGKLDETPRGDPDYNLFGEWERSHKSHLEFVQREYRVHQSEIEAVDERAKKFMEEKNMPKFLARIVVCKIYGEYENISTLGQTYSQAVVDIALGVAEKSGILKKYEEFVRGENTGGTREKKNILEELMGEEIRDIIKEDEPVKSVVTLASFFLNGGTDFYFNGMIPDESGRT